jgi:hypothetical protein
MDPDADPDSGVFVNKPSRRLQNLNFEPSYSPNYLMEHSHHFSKIKSPKEVARQ